MSSKRKRSELEDSDDDEPSLGKQVLPIANLPADFNGEPEDGLQYLFMVRRDARSLPHTTRVDNPYQVEEKPQVPTDSAQPTNDHLPSEEWREVFVYRFKNFRKNCMQTTVHANLPLPTTHKIMPDRKDRDHWWAFLNGRPESEWNPQKKPKKQNNRNERYGDYNRGMRGYSFESGMHEQSHAGPSRVYMYQREQEEINYEVPMDPSGSLPTPSGTPAPPDYSAEAMPLEHLQVHPIETGKIAVPGPPQPTPDLMRDIDHRYAMHLLMYFAHWVHIHLEEDALRKYVVTETHARWMFVLLSRVDDYITADETNTLRSLARGCMGLIKLRMEGRLAAVAESNLGEATKSSEDLIAESSCWMVITAVIGLWAQRDLWQDAEAMLAKVAS